MKYPQLVSTKAVNEISDWLIKRLEDLDIEHPGVYSRLLLSLLHTPFKVNAIDLLEDLKQPHHLLNKSNEELKRLAAVESLMEVSAEQNKSNIINLVDELHSKLRKIETNCEESSMNSRTSNSLNSSPISSSKFYKNLKKIKKNHGMENCSTKNYYLAFPALSGKVSSTITTNANNLTAPASNETTTTLSANFEMNKEAANWNFFSWSKLISKKNDDSSTSSKLLSENNSSNNGGYNGTERMKTPLSRRKRRYGKTKQKSFSKTDVQFENSTFSPKKMQMVKNSTKRHQRNNYDTSLKTNKNCDIRNNNNFSKNAPKLDLTTTGSTAPWDMDFKGHWEMDRDLISEFIQQQKGVYHRNHQNSQKQLQQQQSYQDFKVVDQIEKCMKQQQVIEEEEDDAIMLKRCLPTKLMVDESPIVDDPFNAKVKPCNNKETFSISSLKLKFDENVKAIWSDVDGNNGNDLMKPLTQKQYYFDDDGTLSLASSFTSEKNSLSLFNFNEQTHHLFEVNVPPQLSTAAVALAPSEINHYHQHQLQQPYKNANVDYDHNNNSNPMASFYGGRGAMSKSSSSFTVSPKQSDQMIKSSDFIKSGTNLQASIWSDGDFPSDAENLVLKEVADLKDDANNVIYKNLSSIGAEIKHWQNCNNNSSSNNSKSNDTEVTLFNHSEKSAFKKFRPLLSSTIIRANYHPLNKNHSDRTLIVDSMESENYLTSEKTHFSPIIRDGHTFVIDNNWDEIKYERSPSGENLMYKNRRYKLWNNNGKMSDVNDIDLMGIENDVSSEFTIKYMLCENDKEVQTNESDFVKPTPPPLSSKSFLEINEEYCKRKIYDEYFKSSSEPFIGNKNKWRYINNAEDSNDYSFFSVNRVKENSNTLNPPSTFHNILLSSNSSSSSICTITSSYDASAIDQFESWRNNVKVSDNGDRVETDYKQICMHRLWEQCVTCSKNNEDMHLEKPLPASRLMKDELQLDGDEIMNVIQNLYITSDYCEDDEEKDDNCDDFDDMNHVYMNMILDDSMDGTCTLEDENKFYEPTVDVKNQKNFASNIIEAHQKADLLNLENFDDITLTKMQWQLDKKQEMNKDYEKYLKLLNWIKASLVANNTDEQTLAYNADKNNNNCQDLCEVHRPKNRKRRHSTCQNFLENKRTSIEEGLTYRLNLDNSLSPLSTPAPQQLYEDYSNLFYDAAKMLKVNIEKILLISNPSCIEVEQNKDSIEGANYYRNILQQQHALIKQLDLSRPLTR